MVKASKHYDLLIKNGNDPLLDDERLRAYMDKYDGQAFILELELDKTKSVLDIGCGTGRMLEKINGSFGRYDGIDISPKTVETARRHFAGYENINFINADFLKHDFNSTYNLIFSTLSFMHIRQKAAAIIKIFSLLKQNGKFVLSIDKSKTPHIDTGYSKIAIYPDEPKKIEKLLKKTGFTSIKTQETELAYIISAYKKTPFKRNSGNNA